MILENTCGLLKNDLEFIKIFKKLNKSAQEKLVACVNKATESQDPVSVFYIECGIAGLIDNTEIAGTKDEEKLPSSDIEKIKDKLIESPPPRKNKK